MEDKNQSEVACLLEQIRKEYETAQRGLTGIAEGRLRHHFIRTSDERMHRLKQALDKTIGEDSIALVYHATYANENQQAK